MSVAKSPSSAARASFCSLNRPVSSSLGGVLSIAPLNCQHVKIQRLSSILGRHLFDVPKHENGSFRWFQASHGLVGYVSELLPRLGGGHHAERLVLGGDFFGVVNDEDLS